MNIQWYPGHMTKTRRMIAEQIKNVDAVCEILDARIPVSSRNPDVDELTAGKPRMVVLNRVDQADPEGTKRWAEHFRAKGYAVLESDAKSGVGTAKFAGAVRELLADKLRAYAEKGMTGRVVRVMILGIPNVGKSTFINKVAGRKTAKTEDRPGVTRSKQWVPIDRTLELLDTPGIISCRRRCLPPCLCFSPTGGTSFSPPCLVRSWPPWGGSCFLTFSPCTWSTSAIFPRYTAACLR